LVSFLPEAGSGRTAWRSLEGFSFCVSDITALFCIRCLGDAFNSSSVVVIIETVVTK
jgi:hypothetical protein